MVPGSVSTPPRCWAIVWRCQHLAGVELVGQGVDHGDPRDGGHLLDARLRRDPSAPFVTFYDDATGERTELSVITYANWIAKTANLLTDEYLLGAGDVIRVELPPHWLGTVFLGAAHTAGVAVTTDPATAAHLVVRGPDRLEQEAPDVPVVACSLTPFATPFDRPLPEGVDYFGTLWPGQPDGFLGARVEPTTTGCRHGGTSHSQAELLDIARQTAAGWQGDRLITDVDPLTDCGSATFLPALSCGGSMVLITNAEDDQWPARHEGERATDLLRSAELL